MGVGGPLPEHGIVTALADVRKGWRLPADSLPVVFADHAVARFGERLRPGLVREVGRAWRDGDEIATRTELRVLAAEASLLATMDPLPFGSMLACRQRIAAEADRFSGTGS